MVQSPILITGGAGFLGINLCRHLLARGMRPRSIDIAPFDYPEQQRVEVVQADIRDPVAVERALTAVDTVIHCAAALPRASAAEIHSTNVEGTRLLLERAAYSHVQRFVFISSTAVYGIPKHEPIVESDALSGVGPYGESKILAERLCREARADALCVPILRPKTFIGPERLGVFELLYEWAYEGHNFPVLGSGGNSYQLLDVQDLCNVIERCCRIEAAVANDIFNVGALQFCSMRDNVQSVLDRAGHGARTVTVPRLPAVAALRMLEFLGLSPLYPWIYATAGRESWVSIERLMQRLLYTPRFSNREALVRNYDWYAAHRREYLGKIGRTHRLPWKHGALELVKHVF
jgi:nucleoside-diphosphate-sugar epimerase